MADPSIICGGPTCEGQFAASSTVASGLRLGPVAVLAAPTALASTPTPFEPKTSRAPERIHHRFRHIAVSDAISLVLMASALPNAAS